MCVGKFERRITKTCPCNIKLVFFRRKKSLEVVLTFLIFLLKTYIVGTR